MTNQPAQSARASSRKPQINIEVTEEEKEFFGQLADARGLKLAALVRELLNTEAVRLGVPTQLETYSSEKHRSRSRHYQYIVDATEPTEIKLGLFRQFLLKFRLDCDFSITGYEPDSYSASVQCTAHSSSGESSNTIFIGISSDRLINYKERKEIDRIWHEVLGLSLNLNDKWNGTNYVVEKRRTLKGKQLLLKQFVEKYTGAKFDVNDSFGGGDIFKVTANTEDGKILLLIELLPQRVGEVGELKAAFDDYLK